MDYITNDTDLTTVANAIRTKGGTSASLEFPSGFASAIAALPSGYSLFATGNFTLASDVAGGTVQTIMHGLGVQPKIVIVVCDDELTTADTGCVEFMVANRMTPRSQEIDWTAPDNIYKPRLIYGNARNYNTGAAELTAVSDSYSRKWSMTTTQFTFLAFTANYHFKAGNYTWVVFA